MSRCQVSKSGELSQCWQRQLWNHHWLVAVQNLNCATVSLYIASIVVFFTIYFLRFSDITEYNFVRVSRVRSRENPPIPTNEVYVDWRLLADTDDANSTVDYTVYWCKLVNGTCQVQSLKPILRFRSVTYCYSCYELYWVKPIFSKFQNEFDWIDIDKNANNHSLETKSDPRQYQFGVSVSLRGMRSGISWAKCLYGISLPDEAGIT